MELTSKNVDDVITTCMFGPDDFDGTPSADNLPEGAVVVEGITNRFVLNGATLEQRREDVASMLSDLPKVFHHDSGEGMSFLNACIRQSDGMHWGEHQTMESLFVLGMGLDMVKTCLPRLMWHLLPGGMPYFVVNTEGFPEDYVSLAESVAATAKEEIEAES